ncbi:MAG: Gfo/Idh/MocA family oxidoreductase [Chitinophagaceae bacterium]|nr:Gfo/Idh/MocA family oxidoreductase [Chitinophagaceae bacterium]MCW5928751.1 Gfo/Idh/MocA family oxidoreductase [Chitinophagaceae bacterium]
MERTINWGILGCGKIAHKFASDLLLVNHTKLLAVASRNKSNAADFASKYGANMSYDNYEALLSHPGIDVIYVATPHGLHHEHVMHCLQYGKAVLCEKAFALNSNQAKQMIDTAREKKLFLMEAFWSKFSPPFITMMQQIREGRLGEIKSVLANFGFIPQPPVADRIFDPALGGGTLLDIGIYNVFYALSVLGKPDMIETSMTPASTGVDEQCAILFKYNSGAFAQLFSSFTTQLPTEMFINGDRGRIKINSRFYTANAVVEFYLGFMDSRELIPIAETQGWGYHYEATHVNECLRKGLTESPVMTHADTLLLMETLDRIREKWK